MENLRKNKNAKNRRRNNNMTPKNDTGFGIIKCA